MCKKIFLFILLKYKFLLNFSFSPSSSPSSKTLLDNNRKYSFRVYLPGEEVLGGLSIKEGCEREVLYVGDKTESSISTSTFPLTYSGGLTMNVELSVCDTYE